MLRAQVQGQYLAENLRESLLNVPWAGDIRSAGLLAGVEIVSDADAKTPASNDFMRHLVRYLATQARRPMWKWRITTC